MKQQQPGKGSKSGLKEGETSNNDHTGKAKRPVSEEDVFGGAERAKKGEPVRSNAGKP